MGRSMWIQLLDRAHLVRIIETDVGQSKVAAALQAYGEAGVEPADTRYVPTLGIAVGAQKALKRNIPVVAGHKVMPHVPRRLTISTDRIAGVPLGSNVVQRLGVGVGEQVSDVARAAFRRHLQ